jgi:hypothetical protein
MLKVYEMLLGNVNLWTDTALAKGHIWLLLWVANLHFVDSGNPARLEVSNLPASHYFRTIIISP